VDEIRKKARLEKDPDMSSFSSAGSSGGGADSWMGDALALAEEVRSAGEGDLLEMGEFHDVEYKVSPLLCSVLDQSFYGIWEARSRGIGTGTSQERA
jgi:hypothetical protein